MRDIALITVECARADHAHVGAAFPEAVTGVAAGHYTRPSLAALLSGQYRAAVQTRVREPTLAGVLSAAGYTTLGYSYSPQTSAPFDFPTGFDAYHTVEPSTGPLGRGSVWRERLGRHALVRRVHHYLKPKMPGASLATEIKTDREVVADALAGYRDADGPRFLWVHLMGSHRPYGWGEAGLPAWLDRKAANASPGGGLLSTSLTDAEHDRVVDAYERSLGRVGEHVARLRDAVADDAIVAVAGDHGDELGEAGYYFHGGYRRRVVDAIAEVAVSAPALDLPDTVGLPTLPRRLAEAVGVDAPAAWVRPSTGWLTVAPWADRATVGYRTPAERLVFRDASIDHVSRAVAERAVDRQLRALGYAEER